MSGAMSHVDQSVLSQIAEAIGKIGTEQYTTCLAKILQSNTSYDSLFISAFFKNSPPEQLYSNLSPMDEKRSIAPYFVNAYLLDPWYLRFLDGIDDGVYRLAKHVADEFTHSEYYCNYYAKTALRDEMGVFIHINDEASLVLSLGRRSQNHDKVTNDKAFLDDIFDCTRAMCRQHWPLIKVGEGAIIGSFNTRVRALVDRFGSETLSEREHEIVQLILQGHSGKSMARMLGVSPETVKVFRKRIHHKLNIHSQGELFSRLLASLTMITSDHVGDPLVLLRQNPKKQ